VVVTVAQLVDLRRLLRGERRLVEILAVLAATAVGTEHRCHERERTADAIVGHLLESIREHGVPVAVAPIDRQCRTVRVELLSEGGDQRASLAAYRAHAAEGIVALGDTSFDRGWQG
jgi:hypothetical protein